MLKLKNGFTMMEMMVALVLLSIGLLGFTAMSVLMIKSTRTASKMDEASTLSQATIEDMGSVTWDNLGTDTTAPAANGYTSATVRTEGPLNKNGFVDGTSGQTGPYIFYRHLVVCSSTTTVAAGASPSQCAGTITSTNRPPQLSCNGSTLTTREKLLRVLISWSDRNGECRFKAVDSLVFQ